MLMKPLNKSKKSLNVPALFGDLQAVLIADLD
jgi:hypothetical protein